MENEVNYNLFDLRDFVAFILQFTLVFTLFPWYSYLGVMWCLLHKLQFVPCSCLTRHVYNYIVFNWYLLNCMKSQRFRESKAKDRHESCTYVLEYFQDILSFDFLTTWNCTKNFCTFVCANTATKGLLSKLETALYTNVYK